MVAVVGTAQIYVFPHRTLFQFICPHLPNKLGSSRAGYLSLNAGYLSLNACLCSLYSSNADSALINGTNVRLNWNIESDLNVLDQVKKFS